MNDSNAQGEPLLQPFVRRYVARYELRQVHAPFKLEVITRQFLAYDAFDIYINLIHTQDDDARIKILSIEPYQFGKHGSWIESLDA